MSLFKRTQKIVDNSRRNVELGDKSVFVEKNHGTINVNVDMPALNKLFEELRGSFGTEISKHSIRIEHIIEDKIEAQILNIRDEISENGKAVVEVINERIAELCNASGKKYKALTAQISELQARLQDKSATAKAIEAYIEKAQKQSKAAADKLEKSVIDRIDALSKQIEQAATEIKEHTTEEAKRAKQERVHALLQTLREEIQKDYIDGDKVQDVCEDIKRGHAAEDIKQLAEFYIELCGDNGREKNKQLQAIDLKKQAKYINDIARVCIVFLDSDIAANVGDLLERAYQLECFTESEYNEWLKLYEQELCKINGDVYNVNEERDIFIAYKSEDIKAVMSLREFLIKKGFKCFVAAYNLQHSIGMKYRNKIETAIGNCRALVFVSSRISRHKGDAVTFEFECVQKLDREFARQAGELFTQYSDIPSYCKMPRAEFLLEKYSADEEKLYIIDAMFGESNWIHGDKEELAKYIGDEIRKRKVEIAQKVKEGRNDKKYCLECGTESDIKNKHCGNCGKTEFGTYMDWCDVQLDREKEKLAIEREELEKRRHELDERENDMRRQVEQVKAELEVERKAKQALQAEYETALKKAEAEVKKIAAKMTKENAEKAAKEKEEQARAEKEAIEKVEQDAAEKAAKEAAEKSINDAAKEAAKIKAEQAAKEIAARAAKENAEREAKIAKERAEKEAKEMEEKARAEKEAAEEAAERAAKEVAEEYYQKGLSYYNNSDYAHALESFGGAAAMGHASAQNFLGICYSQGRGIEKNYIEAVQWYKKAAEQNNMDAQYNLGQCYYYGTGVKKYFASAVKWYKKAAEQGHSWAQYMLGWCYAHGEGVAYKSYSEAVAWYRKAAERRNPAAQYQLGRLYERGVGGIEQDFVEAVDWYKKASGQGYKDAIERLSVLKRENPTVNNHNTDEFGIQGVVLKKYKGREETAKIPYGIKNILEYAFKECKSLKDITIPESVTVISENAFYMCTHLQNVTIKIGVKIINDFAFSSCYNLTSVEIPNSVTKIGYGAFLFSNLTSIKYNGTKAQWKAITKDRHWKDNSGKFTVYCTDGSISKLMS